MIIIIIVVFFWAYSRPFRSIAASTTFLYDSLCVAIPSPFSTLSSLRSAFIRLTFRFSSYKYALCPSYMSGPLKFMFGL